MSENRTQSETIATASIRSDVYSLVGIIVVCIFAVIGIPLLLAGLENHGNEFIAGIVFLSCAGLVILIGIILWICSCKK